MNTPKLGLYFHFPFCQQKCHYCSLFSQAGLEQLVPAYLEAVKLDLLSYESVLSGREISTIYIGGGTPSLLTGQQLNQLLAIVRGKFKVVDQAEISIEANPETLSLSRLDDYYQLGVNRLSLGLQAWQDRLLKKMGRLAKSRHFIQSLAWAKQVGFTNINADLIFGLPDQTLDDWQESLAAVIDAQLSHLACYSLEVDERSTWGRLAAVGKFKTVTEELDRAMAQLAVTKLTAAGLKQYEISNFARPGFECQHNLNFWLGNEYLGIGAGAHSFFNRYRFNNTYSITSYINQIRSANFSRQEKVWQSDIMIRESDLIAGLRLNKGIFLSDFQAKFVLSILKIWAMPIERLMENGLIEINQGYLKLTDQGRDLENLVMTELLS